MGRGKGGIPWNKGLTKESDVRVLRLAQSLSGVSKGYLGKSYEEIYGVEKAVKLKHDRSIVLKELIASGRMRVGLNAGKSCYWIKGDKNPNWQGGVSRERYEAYGPGFTKDLKRQVFERDGFVCRLCGAGGELHPHHIDYNKKNNCLENLISLCPSCHAKTGVSYMRGYYEILFKRSLWLCGEGVDLCMN